MRYLYRLEIKRVGGNTELSVEIEQELEVRQGYDMSQLLFNIMLYYYI